MDEAYDDEFFEGGDWRVRAAVGAALLLVVLLVLWFGVLGGGDGSPSDQLASASSPSQPPVTTTDGAATTLGSAPQRSADDDPSADPSIDDTGGATDDADDANDTGGGRSDVDEPTPTSVATTVPATSTTVAPTESTYATLPDGRPVPVLAIYDGELITLSGSVPSQEAAERLRVLALANSVVPNAEVASFLAVDPAVPVGVGARVIEVNSPRFAEGSATVSEEHAAQLDRVVTIMIAMPNITVDVIGHADQRGDAAANFELSTERARAAADYVATQGIDPTRLSSRGAGESDLLTLNDDQAALALNRRTEFVFYGLLVDAAEPE